MKSHLILVALLSCAAWGAPSPAPQQVKPISTAQPARDSRVTPATRHLTDEQRAELRRQLYQFNKTAAKRP